jgi:UDP-glucose 4-epimerase
MIRLLVTGSSGYLGSQFIKEYAEKYCISRFSLQSQSSKYIDFEGLDAILHCAGIVHQGQKVSSAKYNQVNVKYPVDLAKLAKANGVNQFVFISSVSVYGPMEYIDEESDCNPNSKYGQSKLKAENELLELNDDQFTVSILRIPMIYGPQAPGNIRSAIKLVNYLPIIPLGNINNRRSFISIRNLVYSIDWVLNCRKEGIFLLADDETISTSSLISSIIDGVGKSRLLLDSGVIRLVIRLLAPSVYKKLWGNLVINCRVSKELLGLDFPDDVKAGLADMWQLKQ